MTGARVFYGLLTVVTVAGVATTLIPAIRTAVAIGALVVAVLAVATTVATVVAVEVRWNREMDQIIAAPAIELADHDLVAK